MTDLDAIRARLAAHDTLNRDRREHNVLVSVEAAHLRTLLARCDALAAALVDAGMVQAELEVVRSGMAVNLRVREDEVLVWARRLIEADARVLQPWLPQARAALASEGEL